MSWTTTPPSLPSGASYSAVGSGWTYSANKYSTTGTVSIARLNTNQVSIRFVLNTGSGSTSTFAPPSYMDFKVGDSTKSYGWGASMSKTVYWTGTLNKDAAIKTVAGSHYSGSAFSEATYHEKNAKGPAYVTKYTITYHSNNGAGATAAQSKTYGSAVNLYSCGWTKDGHTFDHWDTAADGSGSNYSAGQSYGTNANLTLYAIWAPNTYAITYDANGGTGSTAGQTKTYGQALTLRGNGFTAPTGHHFVEWNTAANRSGTRYAAGGSYTANAAATLYATWEPDTYAVGFHPNGADGGAQEPRTKTYGSRLVLPGCGFTKTGYSFAEWNTAPDGTGASYPAGSCYEANEPVTLYAIWTKNNIPVYLNDGGTIRQAVKAYRNVDGEIRECAVYAKINGVIREIR